MSKEKINPKGRVHDLLGLLGNPPDHRVQKLNLTYISIRSSMRKQKIWVIDYGLGNIQSVVGAFLHFGVDVIVSSSPDTKADKIVLPGVGAFGKGIENLEKLNLINVIYEEVKEKQKPFLGICLGMQLLCDSSEESEGYRGLSLIAGKVRHLRNLSSSVRIPNIGWGETEIKPHKLFKDMNEKEYFYYIHSYYVEPLDKSIEIATFSSPEVRYTSSIVKRNIFGVQFHPEKSGQKGLKVIQNFLDI